MFLLFFACFGHSWCFCVDSQGPDELRWGWVSCLSIFQSMSHAGFSPTELIFSRRMEEPSFPIINKKNKTNKASTVRGARFISAKGINEPCTNFATGLNDRNPPISPQVQTLYLGRRILNSIECTTVLSHLLASLSLRKQGSLFSIYSAELCTPVTA